MKTSTARARPWLTFLLALSGLAYAAVEGGYQWRGRFDVQLAGLVLFGGGGLAWLAWRTFFARARLPRSGLGWVFALGLASVTLSLLFSQDPRQGLWRATWLAGYVLLFYILLDAFAAGLLERGAALAALLWVSGALLLLALLETYAWYLGWFGAVGRELPPFQYRFGSIFGYSNVLMSLANLGAPLALALFTGTRRRSARIGAAAWLVLFLVAVPFSSSRGGWIGIAGWLGCLALAWFLEQRPWRWLVRLSKPARLALGVGGLAALAGVAALGLRFWLAFSSHPSHGGDPFGGRLNLWGPALQLWQRSPLLGIGPGRYALEQPSVNPNFPPLFWSYNAHGLPVEILAEFGLLGAGVFLALIAAAGWKLLVVYRALLPGQRLLPRAVLAALAGWLCQMLVDDFTSWIAIMVPLLLLAAWLWTARPAEGEVENVHPIPGPAPLRGGERISWGVWPTRGAGHTPQTPPTSGGVSPLSLGWLWAARPGRGEVDNVHPIPGPAPQWVQGQTGTQRALVHPPPKGGEKPFVGFLGTFGAQKSRKFSAPSAPEGRKGQGDGGASPFSLGWLLVPAGLLLGYAAWDLWAYQPAWQARPMAAQGRWTEAALALETSRARDPNLRFYAAEAGFAWAAAWGETGDLSSLASARRLLAASVAQEGQFTQFWAVLAVLDGQAGESQQALERLAHAAELSPLEASYPLNLGYLQEQLGQTQAATQSYRRALELAPAWASHPFWQASALRRDALAKLPPTTEAAPRCAAAQAQMDAGQLDEPARSLAFAALEGEPGTALAVGWARLAGLCGDPAGQQKQLAALRDSIALPVLRTQSNLSFGYTLWAYNRPGLLADLVPGYLRLDGDYGQYTALAELHTIQIRAGECAQAARTWQVWQSALLGFAPETLPPPPDCP